MSTVKNVTAILDELGPTPQASDTAVLKKLFGSAGALNMLLKASSMFKKGGFYVNMGSLVDEYKKLKIESMMTDLKNKVPEMTAGLEQMLQLSEELNPQLEENFKLKTEIRKFLNTSYDFRDIRVALAYSPVNIVALVITIRNAMNISKLISKNKDALQKMKTFRSQYTAFRKTYDTMFGKGGTWKSTTAKLQRFLAKCKTKCSAYKDAKEKDNKTILGKISKISNKELDEVKMRFCNVVQGLEVPEVTQ